MTKNHKNPVTDNVGTGNSDSKFKTTFQYKVELCGHKDMPNWNTLKWNKKLTAELDVTSECPTSQEILESLERTMKELPLRLRYEIRFVLSENVLYVGNVIREISKENKEENYSSWGADPEYIIEGLMGTPIKF